MKGNDGPKGQKLQNAAGRGADKICLNFIRKFGNLGGGGHMAAQRSKKWKEMKPERPKWKEMKAQKAKNWKMQPVSALVILAGSPRGSTGK